MAELLFCFPPPSEEGEDGPEGATVIGLPGEMFPGHFLDGRRIKNSGRGDEGGFGQVLSPSLEILLEP